MRRQLVDHILVLINNQSLHCPVPSVQRKMLAEPPQADYNIERMTVTPLPDNYFLNWNNAWVPFFCFP
jgi:hypothetical protein